jgi:hypothetical protein
MPAPPPSAGDQPDGTKRGQNQSRHQRRVSRARPLRLPRRDLMGQ